MEFPIGAQLCNGRNAQLVAWQASSRAVGILAVRRGSRRVDDAALAVVPARPASDSGNGSLSLSTSQLAASRVDLEVRDHFHTIGDDDAPIVVAFHSPAM